MHVSRFDEVEIILLRIKNIVNVDSNVAAMEDN